MKESKFIYRIALITGLLVIGTALLRTLNINNLLIAADTGDISKHYSTTVVIGWTLSCAMMFLVGIWILFLAGPLKKLQRNAWWQGIIISLSFMAFGGFFWFRFPKSFHLPWFVFLGFILFVPLLLLTGKFRKPKP